MTTLVNTILETELNQNVTYNNTVRLSIAAFYPYLLMVNSPSGTFTFSLFKGAEELYSKSFTSADIKASLDTTDNYAHVFFPIIPENPIQIESGAYTFKLQASGYTVNTSSYLAWVQQHEYIQTELENEIENFTELPFSVRIKSYTGA